METIKLANYFDFKSLPQEGKTIIEYVWLGGTGYDLRSKAKTYEGPVNSIDDVEEWNFDGSSTYQALTWKSEIIIRPVALFNDPFRGAPNKIVLCETYTPEGKPTNTNFRHFANKIFKQDNGKHDPWFGIEQEYVITETTGTSLQWPLGWPKGSYPRPQGPYYCGVGNQNSYGREIMNAHYKACIYAGVKIYGTNAEVMPSQWEFQVGTCNGIEVGDHLWMARYLLHRVAEYHNVGITFDPKPIKGDWNGSGCHTNYSTNGTRKDTNMKLILDHMEKLEQTHSRLISLYGENNSSRLTGK